MNAQEEHRQWLVESRKKMLAIIEQTPNRELKFSWSGLDYSLRRIGIVADYATSYDLTASILDWWLDHQPGDVPPFDEPALFGAMRQENLLNQEVVRIVWAHLYGPVV